MKISIVSPVFDEEVCVCELYRQLSSVLPQIADDYEIVLVDDGSRDSSWSRIADIASRDQHVKGIRFSRNFGHHYAISAGLDHCNGDWVVIMDSDLQDPPEAIPELLKKALEGYDIVVALRANRKFSAFKNLTSKLFYKLFRYLTDTDYDGAAGVFRIMSRRSVAALRRFTEVDRFFPALAFWIGFPQGSITVTHGKRYAGTTKYPFAKQLALAVNASLSFSDKPIVLVVYCGLLVAGFSALFTLYIVLRAIFGSFATLGYASLMSAIFFTGGVVMTTLGLVGLYVGRIFRQVKGRPLYIVSDYCNGTPVGERERVSSTSLRN